MPRGRNVGFVSNVGAIAHELGHGAFGLEHTFDKNPASKNNLMDYGGGSFLTQAQWKKIQNPGVIINWFDDAEDAMFLNFLVGGIIGGFADGVSQFAISFIDEYDDNKSITDISAAAVRKISVLQVLIAVGAGAISSGLSSEASVAKFATRLASNVKVQAAIITGIEAGLDFIIGVTGDQVNNYFKDKTSKQTGQQIVIDNLISSSLFAGGSALMKTEFGGRVKSWLLKKAGKGAGDLFDNALIAELRIAGINFTEADLKLITKDFDRKILFLEKGSSSAGFQHIIERHWNSAELMRFFNSQEEMIQKIYSTIKNDKYLTKEIVTRNGREGLEYTFEIIVNTGKRTFKFGVGSNGYIVTFYPQ